MNVGYKADQLASLLAASQQAAAGHNGVSRHQASFPGSVASNGHNDNGLKKSPLLTHKLNGTEITAVRQLITGVLIFGTLILIFLFHLIY